MIIITLIHTYHTHTYIHTYIHGVCINFLNVVCRNIVLKNNDMKKRTGIKFNQMPPVKKKRE